MNQNDFSIHLTLLFPFLIIVMGAGIVYFLQVIPGKYTVWTSAAVILLYALSIAEFSELYFFRAPAEGHADFPKRILAEYLKRISVRPSGVTVYSPASGDTYTKYMYYSDAITRQSIPNLRDSLKNSVYTIRGIQFLSCPAAFENTTGMTIITDANCGIRVSGSHRSITKLTDGGELYVIQNDPLCGAYTLKPYPTGITIQDFNLNRLTGKQFCETYISQR